jgi:hypothetical protein
MRTPAQQRANRYAAFRLFALGCFLGAVWSIEPTTEAHAAWLVTALTCWPYRPDWRL